MKKVVLLSAVLSSFLFAQNAYIKSNQAVSIDNKEVGFVTILTPIEIADKGEKESEISIIGFVQEGYQEKLVKSPALAEEFVVFEKEDGTASYQGEVSPYIKILEKTEDDYGEIWLKAEFKFKANNANIITDPDPIYTNAKNLFKQTCSACHVLHEPNSYTVNQWPHNLKA